MTAKPTVQAARDAGAVSHDAMDWHAIEWRRVHQQKHDRARDESPHLVEAADRLNSPAFASPGVVDAARQHCATEQGLHLGCNAPQHLPTQYVDY